MPHAGLQDPMTAALSRDFFRWAVGSEGPEIGASLGYVTLPLPVSAQRRP